MSDPNVNEPSDANGSLTPDQVPTTPLGHATSAPLGAAPFEQGQPHTQQYTQPNEQQAPPAEPAPQWATEQPPATVATDAPQKPLQARLGTIVWGVLLVAFAVIVAVVQLNPDTFSNAANTSVLVTAGLIGAGLLLVLAGIAAAVRKN